MIVEGISDRLAVEALLRRQRRDLAADGITVEPVGGAQAMGRFLARLGSRLADLRLAGLYDVGEEADVRWALERAGLGANLTRDDMEGLGFYACDADLEDELIRSLGTPRVEHVLEAQGDIRSFRKFQHQPAQRGRSIERQLRRFMGTHSGRKAKYAVALVNQLDLANLPRPLDRLLARLRVAKVG